METTMKEMVAALKQKGHKLTPQRRAVLRVIALSQSHLTPAIIHERACQTHPGIGLVTIYRTLNMLHELGFICEVHGEGSRPSYLFRRIHQHHHHLVCSDCGAVVNFTDCDLDSLERRLSEKTGFLIQEHLLEFHGLCPKCRKQNLFSRGER
jgi:Fur family ferric uptake transcriptional regulator